MKGDVKRQFFTDDWCRRLDRDIQPQTTAVGSKKCVVRRSFIVFGYNLVRSSEAVQAYRLAHTPTMVLLETPRPIAFSGYARGHSVETETWCQST
jgi:hypothetical protein